MSRTLGTLRAVEQGQNRRKAVTQSLRSSAALTAARTDSGVAAAACLEQPFA
jgi:hypothetical protein